jgi:hypothetical protein
MKIAKNDLAIVLIYDGKIRKPWPVASIKCIHDTTDVVEKVTLQGRREYPHSKTDWAVDPGTAIHRRYRSFAKRKKSAVVLVAWIANREASLLVRWQAVERQAKGHVGTRGWQCR